MGLAFCWNEFLLYVQNAWYWDRDIPGEWGQHISCWCPGSLLRQVISTNHRGSLDNLRCHWWRWQRKRTHGISWWRHRSPVNSPHKGQWRGALMFSFIYTWMNDWVNNRETGDLRRHPAHYDVTVMFAGFSEGFWISVSSQWREIINMNTFYATSKRIQHTNG